MHEEEARTTPEQISEKPEAESGRQVLLVDDEAPILRVLQRIIKEIDQTAKVTSVASVDEAILVIEKGLSPEKLPPDVILSDMTMPDKTGLDFYKWLNDNRLGLQQRIYFISGGGITEKTIEFLDMMKEQGRLIEKPWENNDVLREELRRVLAKK